MSAEVANIALNAFPSQRPPRTKRGGERRRYIKSKKKFIAVAGQCAVFWDQKAIQTHHVFGRLGHLLNWQPGWMAVSQQGHSWIDANREAARLRGWLAPKGLWNTSPEEILRRIETENLKEFDWVLERAATINTMPTNP